jgi:hypothetical protein
MATFDCWFCKIVHPRPVGRNCLLYKASMAETSEAQQITEGQVTMSSSNIEVGGSHSSMAPITTTAGSGQIPPPSVTQPQVLPPIQRALNSREYIEFVAWFAVVAGFCR